MTAEMADQATERLLDWYGRAARDLPWRSSSVSPWAVLVSEFMLQQTPVVRVLPVFERWLARWPTASDLASEPPGEAVRAWDRLGYPRRALRLHAAATVIVEQHNGVVPADYDQLRALPGVGDYTAAAVAAFAYKRRQPVLDTNVRRVLARALGGTAAAAASVTAAERARAEEFLPLDPTAAAKLSVALMELGALVCRAGEPRCSACPFESSCAWRLAGAPDNAVARRVQRYEGTDRQARGRLLAVLRSSMTPVSRARFDEAWEDPVQRSRALDTLVADGLVEPLPRNRFRLPG
jgi:A/G-specific adenine glycosylase